jgi:hypothetical protein
MFVPSSSGRCRRKASLVIYRPPTVLVIYLAEQFRIQLISSLFFEKFFLLVCLGICSKSHCSAVEDGQHIADKPVRTEKRLSAVPPECSWRHIGGASERAREAGL